MRRITRLVSLVLVLMATMAVAISAQDATPPAGQGGPPTSFELAPGVVADNMVFVEGSDAPINYRLSFDAGVVYEIMPSSNLELVYMESGSLVLTLDQAVTVGRLGETETGGIVVPADTQFTLGTGQFLVFQPGVAGEVRNEGLGTASASVAGITPVQPAATPATPAGSPVATPAG